MLSASRIALLGLSLASLLGTVMLSTRIGPLGSVPGRPQGPGSRPDSTQAIDLAAPNPVVHRLTFPHTANGTGNGLVARSTIVLVNNSETDANGTIRHFGQDGASLEVSSNQGIASVYPFTLLPGEGLRFETDGTGPLTIGWIEVVSDIRISGSGTFLINDSSGRFVSEVGIGDSPRAPASLVFVDTTDGRTTSYAVCNPDPDHPVPLILELRRLDGTLVDTRSDLQLPPGGQQARYVHEIFGDVVRNFRGVLRLSGQDAEIAVVSLRTQGSVLTSLPSSPEGVTAAWPGSLTFARIGDGRIGPYLFRTSIVLLNPSTQPVEANLEVRAEDGMSAALDWGGGMTENQVVQVPPGGALELISSGAQDPLLLGWARVTSPGRIAGSGLFTITEVAGGRLVSQTGVPDSPKSHGISVLGEVTQEVDTGLGLTNLQQGDLPLVIRLYENQGSGNFGTFLAESRLTLPGRGHTAKFVSELFPEVAAVKNRAFEGTVRVQNGYNSTAWEFTALTLQTRGAYFTSLPVAPATPTSFAPRFAFVPATLVEGSRPYSCFRLTQQSGEVPVATADLRVERAGLDLTRLAGAGHRGEMLNYAAGTALYSGRLFVSEVEPDGVQLFPLLTTDGVVEFSPVAYRFRNRAEGGFEIRAEAAPSGAARLAQSSSSSLCLPPGVLHLPDGAPVTVTTNQAFTSAEQTFGTGDRLHRTARSGVRTAAWPESNPRIDRVEPSRLSGGELMEIHGSGFAAGIGGNRVTLAGKVEMRVEAEVVSADADRLVVRLPLDLRGSDLALESRNELRVEVESRPSNPYYLSVAFSPLSELTPGGLHPGSAIGLSLRQTYSPGELWFDEISLTPGAGSWITSGFGQGQAVATLQIGGQSLMLRVKASTAVRLDLEAVTTSGQVVEGYGVTIAAGGSLLLTQKVLPYSFVGGGDPILTFSEPVFRLPSGNGTPVPMDFRTRSVPERTKTPDTRREVLQRIEFRTQ